MGGNDPMLPGGVKIVDDILIGAEVGDFESDDSLSVGQTALNIFESKPEFIAQIDGSTGKRTSFAEMRDRTVKCAIWLRKQGVKPGDMIGLCTDNHLDAITPFLASLCVGAICTTWDHELFPESARGFLELTQPKIVFVHDHSLKTLENASKASKVGVKPIVFEEEGAAGAGVETFPNILRGHTAAELEEFRCENHAPDNQGPAVIVSSSGTTGPPKGTVLSHRSILRSTRPLCSTDKMQPVSMWTATLRWGYGITLALKAIRAFVTRIVVPDFDDEDAYCRLIEKHQVEWFGTDPFIMMQLLKHGTLANYRLPSLKEITIVGAPFKREAHEACANALPYVQVLQMYGMTDSGGSLTKQTVESRPGSAGFLLPGCRLKVADLTTGEPLGPERHGEIRVKTRMIMTEYYKNPEATSRAFDSEGWLRTGDVGYYSANGEIQLVDRISEFINYRSTNVSPAEIEAVLQGHPGVAKAAVVSVLDEIDGEHPVAVVVRVPGKLVTENELTELVDTQLPDYCKLRGGVKFLEKLPVTGTKKIARNELRKMIRAL